MENARANCIGVLTCSEEGRHVVVRVFTSARDLADDDDLISVKDRVDDPPSPHPQAMNRAAQLLHSMGARVVREPRDHGVNALKHACRDTIEIPGGSRS